MRVTRVTRDQYVMPEYGHAALMDASSHGFGGMQSNHWGQVAACSQPQPQSLAKPVVFAGHAKSITAHCSGLLPT